jgi:predicted ATP-grasp superfamily ATP-dependent carboligase
MPTWEPQIRRGFQGTKHYLGFGRLTQQIAKNSDLVVPLDMLGVLDAHRHRSHLSKQVIPIPEKSVALLCDDKLKLNKRLIELGYEQYIPEMGPRLSLPFVLKKRISASSMHTHPIIIEQERSDFHHEILSPEFYCQLMIPDKNEFASHVLMKNKKLIFDLTVKYVFERDYSVKGKDSSKTIIVQSRHNRIFEKLLNDISFSGLCCINYKELDGKPIIIEINPRCGGSLSGYFPSALAAAQHHR